LSIEGMTCSNCARHVTEAIQQVAGVHSAVVSLEGHSARVRWLPGQPADDAGLVHAVQEEGYKAKVLEKDDPSHQHQKGSGTGAYIGGWQLTLWAGLAGTVPLMIGEWGLGLWMTPWFRWLSFVLATIVQFWAGAPFYRGAWSQLKVRSANMDTLVALGSTTAYAFSVWTLLSGEHGHLYFMESSAIITLISVGHWMEARVSQRASSALRALLSLAPDTAHRLSAEGRETEVPVAELVTDDLVVLRPGDRVPTDGRVQEGESAVDESMLTGESVPVDKAPGSELFAGTSNMNGRLVMRVTATGEETALASIIAAVQRAQTSRADIQRLGDRVSSVFVPIVVLIALAAAVWWGLAPESAAALHTSAGRFLWSVHLPSTPMAAAFIIAAAVLIIACPCAMGLATPAAIMAGSNAAARRGILVRDGVALEKAGTVTAVLFDKTGTLTTGKPVATAIWAENEETPLPLAVNDAEVPVSAATSEVIRLACALAAHSKHPVSQAVAALSTENTEVAGWEELRGAGVRGRIKARPNDSETEFELGSLKWLQERGFQLDGAGAFLEAWSKNGATVVGLAGNGRIRALFAVRDTLKSGAPEVVKELSCQGLRVYMVSGDQRATAESIALDAGIDAARVFAEARPEDKARIVERLQKEGERVAFVGDGINDAPALRQANLGIAVSRASDVAREAADLILLKSEIEAVPESLSLARATLRVIKQNLFWAFFYNAAGIPLAALGFMSPILCAAAMGFSDLIVIGNALRLARSGAFKQLR
jgi:Cu+-exporting ATPase